MKQKIARWVMFNWWGWKIEGTLPDLPKYIIAVAPHTSWKDFPLAILLRAALGLKASYIGKESLFKGPFGWLFRLTGGYPVDRSKRSNFVDAVVDMIHSRDTCIIGLAPEGTRKRVSQFRTGFYYMALGAQVPIVLARLDAEHRTIGLSAPFYPTGNLELDMEQMVQYFREAKGFRPERSIFF